MSSEQMQDVEKAISEPRPHATRLLRRPGFSRLSQAGALVSLFAFYLSMFLRYRPYEVDNPWFLSFSYNACVEHIATDQFMDVRFPGGMDGTQYFGRIAAFVQCAVLSRVGWQQWPAAILVATMTVAALGLWCFQLKKLGYSDRFITLFLLVTGLSEPFLSSANRFRYESVSFLLLSAGLLLVSYRFLFWGMLVGALALEVQPIAFAGLIPLVVMSCLTRKMAWTDWLRLLGGGIAAAILYVFLHANLFVEPEALLRLVHGGGGEVGGFIAAYFKDRPRHIVELAVVLLATVVYWRQRAFISFHYAAISATLIVLFSFVMTHANSAYMIFLYPFLVMFMLIAFEQERRWRYVFPVIMIYFVSQYAVLAYVQRGKGYSTSDINAVTEGLHIAAKELRIADDDLRVYGDYGLWYAHPRRYRAASETTLGELRQSDLYLCFSQSDQIAALAPRSMLYCPDIERRVQVHLLQTMEVREKTLYFYAPVR